MLKTSLLVKLHEMGISYFQQGKPADAVAAYLEATSGLALLAERTPPGSNENGYRTLWTFELGEAQHAAGEEEAALSSFRRALPLGEAYVAASPKNLLAKEQLIGALIEFARYAKGDEAAAALARARLLLDDVDRDWPNDSRSHALRAAAEAAKALTTSPQTP